MFNFKLFSVVLLIAVFPLFAQININTVKHRDYIKIELSTVSSINIKSVENLPRGLIINLTGDFRFQSEKLIQRPINDDRVGNFVFQMLDDSLYQLILNGLRNKENVLYTMFRDTVHHVDVYVFSDESKVNSPLYQYLSGLKAELINGDINSAISFYRKAIKLAGEYGNAYYRAGIIRFKQNKVRDARINFSKALKQGTDSIRVNYYLAQTYLKLNQPKQANIYSERFQKISSRQDSVYREKVKMMERTVSESPIIVPEANKNSSKYALYFIPLLLLLFVIVIAWLKKNSVKEELEEEEGNREIREDLSEREREFLEMLQKKQSEIEEPVLQGKSNEEMVNIVKEEVQVEEEPIEETMMEPEEHDEKVEKARELNVGVGELDLALNLKAKMRNKNNLASQEDLILEMFREGIKKEEIAKKLQLNFGEVDLVIELNKHKLKK
ncbi:MAG: hypothetical protein Kow00108_11050 [Calditrichia bacterium]